jgi:hypothetical protein
MEKIYTEQTERGKKAGVRCNGASNHSDVERENNDFYATHPNITQVLIDYLKKEYPGFNGVWEPACGKGDISKTLIKNGIDTCSSDLIDRGFGQVQDFLSDDIKSTNFNIITNPPYKYAQEFVEKSMEILDEGKLCCMLLKLTFLEGNKRYEMFKKYPPKKILVFSNRIQCALGGDFEKYPALGGAVAYAWYIWEKGYNGCPQLEWVKCKN